MSGVGDQAGVEKRVPSRNPSASNRSAPVPTTSAIRLMTGCGRTPSRTGVCFAVRNNWNGIAASIAAMASRRNRPGAAGKVTATAMTSV